MKTEHKNRCYAQTGLPGGKSLQEIHLRDLLPGSEKVKERRLIMIPTVALSRDALSSDRNAATSMTYHGPVRAVMHQLSICDKILLDKTTARQMRCLIDAVGNCEIIRIEAFNDSRIQAKHRSAKGVAKAPF